MLETPAHKLPQMHINRIMQDYKKIIIWEIIKNHIKNI